MKQPPSCLRFLSIFAGVVLIAHLGYGRLGENETQCDVRYNHSGDIIQPSGLDAISPLLTGSNVVMRTYNCEGWIVRLAFTNGIARCIQYAKPDSSAITEKELAAMLNANAAGRTWRGVPHSEGKTNASIRIIQQHIRSSDVFPRRFWLRSDGAIAYKPLVLEALRLEDPTMVREILKKADMTKVEAKPPRF